jgi:hypothetical protein
VPRWRRCGRPSGQRLVGGGTRRFVGVGIPEQVHRVAAGARVGTFAADPILGRTTHPEKQAQAATSLGWEMW